jgi:oligopeptide transport system substrate-binding protein
LPFVERAVYSLESESIPYWNKFLQGFYDSSGISSDAFDQAIQFDAAGEAGLTDDMREKGIDLVTAVDTSIWYMGFNMVDPLLGGDSERARLLRQAISIAVDFGEYISIFANGRGVEAQGAIPPGIFGHREGRTASILTCSTGKTIALCARASIRPSNCWHKPAIETAATRKPVDH